MFNSDGANIMGDNNMKTRIYIVLIVLCLAILAIGSCVYSGAGAKQNALYKMTGVELTRWETLNFGNPIIIEKRRNNADEHTR